MGKFWKKSKFWENANHLDRTAGGLAALGCFVFAIGILVVGAKFAVSHPGGWWWEGLGILIISVFISFCVARYGVHQWQESKQITCAMSGCDKPVASLGDILCSEHLREREQKEADALQQQSEPPALVVVDAEVVSEESKTEAEPPAPAAAEDDSNNTAKGESRARPCLICQKPCGQREDGEYYWWCVECWTKRKLKAEEDNSPPQCMADGCVAQAGEIWYPWCAKCWEYKKERERDPIVARNGERVKSRAERRIANFLHQHGISYKYEKPLEKTAWTCDFVISPGGGRRDVYIEYFGWTGRGYNEQMEKKKAHYRANGLDLLALRPEKDDEPGDLEKRLTRELRNREFKI